MPKGNPGRPKSVAHRRKLSQALRGNIPWNKGKKGLQTSWCKGLRGVLTAWNKGKKCPWVSEFNRRTKGGQKLSAEMKRRIAKSMRRARKTYAPVWNKGLTKKLHPSVASMAKKLRGRKVGPRPMSSKNGLRRFWYYGRSKRIKMRSRWEVAYAHYLNSRGVRWAYEAFTFVTPNGSYTPDFYLLKEGLFIEIKGGRPVTDERRTLIRSIRKHYGVRVRTLRGPDLCGLGILDRHLRVVPRGRRCL